MELNKHTNYITEIKEILAQARQKAYAAVNTAMVEAYWLVGKRIVDEEQQGEDRAAYGKEILKTLSNELNAEFGKGFSLTNLQNFRKFYLTFGFWGIEQTASAIFTNQIEQTVSVQSGAEMEMEKSNSKVKESNNLIWRTAFAKLTWSHFERIIRVENEAARNYYLTEAAKQNWSVRTLDRNISTLYYHRLISSQKKELVENEMNEKSAEENQNPDDFIKNPTVLEFLKLSTSKAYTEREFEQTLIDNLQQFLLELGKGFSFVARQKHIRTETQDFFVDLVFYNYILKCFVIIELKTTKLNHQDIGQLDMYVRMFDDLETTEGDNPTVGILLCTQTDSTIAKYSVLKENKQLFANKYLPYLPSEAGGGLPWKSFCDIQLPIPHPDKQKEIVKEYNTIVNCIALNNQLIKKLEETAQAIYREWFVDFEFPDENGKPCKSNGSEMLESELGEIPKGWKVGNLFDILELQRGFDLPTQNRKEGSYPIYASTGTNEKHCDYRVKAPGIVTGRSGSLGEVFYIDEDFWPLNKTLWVKHFKNSTPIFAFYILKGINIMDYNAGSAVPTLNRNHIHIHQLIVPKMDIIEMFEKIQKIFFKQIKQKTMQQKSLHSFKDILLSKLATIEN